MKSKSRAFSVIELLVVLFITFSIATALVTNYRKGTRDNNLRTGSQEIVSVLRRAQSGVISGLQYNNATVANLRVSFDKSSNTSYQMCAESDYCAANVLEQVALPENTYLDDLIIEGQGVLNRADAIFSAPFADISFKTDNVSSET